MIDEKDIERLFEAWLKKQSCADQLRYSDRVVLYDIFTSAFTLLLPIIQRQNEALESIQAGMENETIHGSVIIGKWTNEALAFVDEQLGKIKEGV